ncbi:MAG: FMN-binding protein [Gammaproteobacteria bacterium]|nr:FMN-binding protein [Gammaproteobacteria bacterium]
MADSMSGSVLAFLALVTGCGILIAATAALTGERIDANRAQRFQQTVTAMAGPGARVTDLQWSNDVAHLCNGRALLRGIASGYGGDMHWLAAADIEAAPPALTGVRITRHQETPGIADFVNQPERGWLASLSGRSAGEMAQVDTVSGATITSRALRRALDSALQRPALATPECEQ